MRILGIDPGLTGGCSILITGGDLDGEARIFDVIDIPTRGDAAKRRVDVIELSRWIIAGRPDRAFIERAGVMPFQHPHSGFIYGRAVGALEAAVILAHVELEVIEPAVWKRHFGLSKEKAAARAALFSIMPRAAAVMPRAKDHGLAEATLIAMYGADLLSQRQSDLVA